MSKKKSPRIDEVRFSPHEKRMVILKSFAGWLDTCGVVFKLRKRNEDGSVDDSQEPLDVSVEDLFGMVEYFLDTEEGYRMSLLKGGTEADKGGCPICGLETGSRDPSNSDGHRVHRKCFNRLYRKFPDSDAVKAFIEEFGIKPTELSL